MNPRTASSLLALLALLAPATPGPAAVTIGGVSYDHVDPGPPFARRPAPAPDWTAPPPTPAEKTAGMMLYVAADPGDYRPDRFPRPGEHRKNLRAALARGQDEAAWFGIYTLRPLRHLRLTLDTGRAPLKIEARVMHFWPQRTGWRSRQWYITPELLLPCRDGLRTVPGRRGTLRRIPFNLDRRQTAAFWLTLSAPPNAPPGRWKTTVRLQDDSGPGLAIPLFVQIYPFRLERPKDHWWLLYADAGRWRAMNDRQILKELRNFARHGITGLVELPLGTPDLRRLRDGRAGFDARPFRRMTALCARAGLPGPHVCTPGGIPEKVRAALGLHCDLHKGAWPRREKDGVAAVARAAVAATRDLPVRWYYYGVDEPSGANTYAIQDYQCWHRGGAQTYATFYDIRFLDTAARFLTAPCFVAGLISRPEQAAAARAACARTGAQFFWYGTGCYVNPFPQEGCMFSNRYGAGFLFWKTGAKAQVSWTFCRAHEDVFNDFDGSRANSSEPKEQVTAYPHLLKPGDWSTYQGAIPTIAWESLREGVDDYAYFAMLARRIARARRDPRPNLRKAAKAAQAELDALTAAIPWRNPLQRPPTSPHGFSARRMNQVRRTAAELIVRLDALLAGSASAETPITPPERHARLNLRTLSAESAPRALPVLVVARTPQPPVIDGAPVEPAWRRAATAGNFRCTRDGRAVRSPATRAKLLYDDRALYLAFTCREPAMAHLVARCRGRDAKDVWNDDAVEFFLGDAARKQYVHFIVNTNASLYDERGQTPAWNAPCRLAVKKGADFWSLEMAIPWTALARAGLPRTPVMSANFCRDRFAGPGACTHFAWSPTFAGFHVPARFGTLILDEGTIELASLRLPRGWGRQALALRLRNTTGHRLRAYARISGEARGTVSLPPHSLREIRLPITLTRPGPARVALEWGRLGAKPKQALLAFQVPAPFAVTAAGGFVDNGGTIELPIRLAFTPAEPNQARLELRIRTGGAARILTFPARTGLHRSLPIASAGPVRLEIRVVPGKPAAAGALEPAVLHWFILGD